MMIQERIYIGLILVSLIIILFGGAYLLLWIEHKIMSKKYDFEVRLHKGEVLNKDNIF